MRSISEKIYAQAFVQAAEGKTGSEIDSVIRNFVELLRKNRDWQRRDDIVRAVGQELRRREGRHSYLIETARELPPSLAERIRKSLGAKPEDLEHKIRPELVAGVRITKNHDEQFDMSLSHIMKKVFPS